ncbi:SAM-dependent methyltransferase [Oleiagrimonas sp. C23AA]|uniref:class I SAM-dependent methyltransferase n=1 Tax=Oleiagrimonas sp. C23AA TaxID=2719047 RepID=UPI001423C805|nr:SAM-dependent methyltransferase [Oleiagrimonas sp. C23AA]NII10516.1 class I SAM-dependent methyltransferase [Oleiagrimonas sp. C23AA]
MAATPIRDVADTAHWIAAYRAMETARPDALFNDPFAERLAGERGHAIVRHMPGGARMAWPLIVRTAVIDELVTDAVRNGAGTVLNLAAGFDTRPYRLPLPSTLRWLHADQPTLIERYRAGMLGEVPRCSLQLVETDLRQARARRQLFERAAMQGPVLVITEGLLVYLPDDQVAALAADLHDIAQARWWITDLVSPRLLKMLKRRWGQQLKAGNAPMQFAPAAGTAFFDAYGWREGEFRSTWDEARRLNRTMKGAAFWQFLSRLQSPQSRQRQRRMSGIVRLDAA